MVFDNVKNIALYRTHGIGDRYAKAAAFLTEEDPATRAPGRYEIDGDNVYANVVEYETVPWEEAKYESHQVYTDIQFVAAGVEVMSFSQGEALSPINEYDKEKDVVHYDNADPGARFKATAGDYCIFKPGEVHKSKGLVGASATIKKVIVKIKEV